MWILYICAAAAVIAAVWIFLTAPRRYRIFELPERGYAHRGLWNESLPENSLAAFEAAARQGFAIETDVQLTSDGVPVIMHDAGLMRMCGDKRRVCECTLSELAELTLDGTAEKIPTLEEMLDTVSGWVPLLIELKGETSDTALCDTVVPYFDRYDGDFVVESFNPLLLRRMKKLRPETVRGQLVTSANRRNIPGNRIRNFALSALLLNFLSRPDFIAYDMEYPHSASLFITTRLLGAKRCVWTVRTRDEYRKFTGNGDCPIFERFTP